MPDQNEHSTSEVSDQNWTTQSEAELLALYAELPQPNERLSDAYPELFNLYCQHFVDFFPRYPYHVKTTYDPTQRYSGWIQKKSKGTHRPLALIDTPIWKNRLDCVERHLDLDHWHLYKRTIEPNRDPFHTDFYWLGQNLPRKCSFNAIDFDNKRVVGHYRSGWADSTPVLPVVWMPLGHFQQMKLIYDAFPDRIWCVTSETLGLDIFERSSRPLDAYETHNRIKRRLSLIGLGDVEVHPMLGRCKRRPFGQHYRTITETEVLTSWQDQLRHYLTPQQTPRFATICRSLMEMLRSQWESWIKRGEAIDRKVIPSLEVVRFKEELMKVEDWLSAGSPNTGPIETIASNTERVTSTLRLPRMPPTKPRSPGLSLQDGDWINNLLRLAKTGLVEDDSLGLVAFEMAKWLWWVELFDIPEGNRHEMIVEALLTYFNNKHNGFVTRLNGGWNDEVKEQLVRCTKRAASLDDEYRSQSIDLFSRIRDKRSSGKYTKIICLLPELTSSLKQVDDSHLSLSLSSSCLLNSVGGLTVLPESIIQMIALKQGRCKLIPFATRLINHLYLKEGIVRLGHEAMGVLLGYTDRVRVSQYIKRLIAARIISKDHYVRGKRSCGYWLTDEARLLIDESFRSVEQKCETDQK